MDVQDDGCECARARVRAFVTVCVCVCARARVRVTRGRFSERTVSICGGQINYRINYYRANDNTLMIHNFIRRISERTVSICGGILFLLFAAHGVWQGPED